MKTLLTPQQTAFFSQNGYIELAGIAFDPSLLFASARTALETIALGRDLWRKEKTLSTLLLHTLSPVVLALTKDAPRLALDQWISPQDLPTNISTMKDFFCIQGITLFALFCETPNTLSPSSFSPSPYPSHEGNVLFIKPNVLVDWAPLVKASMPIYLAAFALANQGVYAMNPKDKAVHFLKTLGYEFGDTLRESHHPLVKVKRSGL